MTTSGTFNFNPDVSDFMDEAFERVGIDPSTLTYRHINSAMRSINLLFSDWVTQGVFQWKIDMQVVTLVKDQPTYTMPAGSMDVLSLVYRQDGIDTPISRISREEYLNIHDKTTDGSLSDQYFVDRQLESPVIYLWPIPDNSVDSIVYYRLVRINDAGTMLNTPDIPFYWQEAMASGLAAKLALKYNTEKFTLLDALATKAFRNSKNEDRDRAPTRIRVKF